MILQAQEWCDSKMSGMTLVAPPKPFEKDPFPEMASINAKWVAVVPYAFTPNNEARVLFGNNHQWWGETPDGARETIRLAKENDRKVMLKPQLWMHGQWVGDMEYTKDRDWIKWEKDYRDYILSFARIAEEMEVELFCIGTEFKISAVKREAFWRTLIQDVRKEYSGMLTYSANWDEFETMPFWDALDIIGLSSYFPLTEKKDPDLRTLKKAWIPIRKRIRAVSDRYQKLVVFTEYGYLSVDGCAGKTWLLEKRRSELQTNEKAQSIAIEALYQSFIDEPYWAGCFYWKWYPFGYHRQKFRANDYTPQGKEAQETIKRWYSKFNQY
ncbi:MAG: hypothetical protein KJO50_04275 [Bacteroidia bacterium]|nr:hypothetical protein [Bacteroidia bacterium]MBT8229451.1 hypothetical protein [Bacteroidia bacterium]NNK89845.1 hypothetical protein [Saprospiraceae bacterium]